MLGGDLTVSEARMKSIDNHKERILIKSPDSKNINFFWALNILINCALGSDGLFVPSGFQCGILQAVLICIGLAIITQLSFYVFTLSWKFGSEFDYVNIWNSLYGPRFRWIPNVLIIFCYISIAVSYAEEVSTELSSIILHFAPSCPEWIVSPWVICYVFTFISLFFCIFARSFADLRYISVTSNLCMLVTGVLVIVLFILKVSNEGFDPLSQLVLWNNSNSESTLECLGVFATIFFIHPFVYHIIIDFDRPTVGRVHALAISTTSFSVIFNIIIGFCGYCTFYELIPGESVLLNYDDNYNLTGLVYAARISNYICVILSLSLYLYLSSYQFTEMVIPSSSKSKISMLFAGMCAACLVVAFNFISQSIFDWFSIIAHFSFLLLSFVLPTIFYFSSYKFGRPLTSVFVIFVFVVGSAIQLYIIIESILSLI